jgi:putative ABC transport system permease protein
MLRFLFKGLLRDRHRSLFPVLTVCIGVMLTVVLHCWITGVLGDTVNLSARFQTGHVKVVTRAYAEDMDQMPNDLALIGTDTLIAELKEMFPTMDWVQRIRFGGLLDVPNAQGETRAQGTVVGLGVDLLSSGSQEAGRLNLREALVKGRLPDQPGEILISDQIADKLTIVPGDTTTFIGATMDGALTLQNFRIAGTVRFGVTALDRGAMIADIRNMQNVLDMQNAASEILGLFKNGRYDEKQATEEANAFNARYQDSTDEFAPVMLRLRDQNDLGSLLDYIKGMIGMFVSIFVLAMAIVLWNAGLIGGLRRYGEIGVRLAIGEYKGHIYRAMIGESILIGLFGSLFGTLIGLVIAWLLQTVGINIGGLMKESTMMMPNTFRAQITPPALVIGFIPGLFATILGTSLSGVGIYRRKTAELFKELEA